MATANGNFGGHRRGNVALRTSSQGLAADSGPLASFTLVRDGLANSPTDARTPVDPRTLASDLEHERWSMWKMLESATRISDARDLRAARIIGLAHHKPRRIRQGWKPASGRDLRLPGPPASMFSLSSCLMERRAQGGQRRKGRGNAAAPPTTCQPTRPASHSTSTPSVRQEMPMSFQIERFPKACRNCDRDA